MSRLSTASRVDIGRVRDSNEDAVMSNDRLAVVADGIGGHPGGEFASAMAVALQFPEIHGPPMYYTPDWQASRISVQKLAALEPEVVVTAHATCGTR